MRPFVFRLAKESDLMAVEALYRTALENPFSVWNQDYPTMSNAKHDFETGNLFVLANGEQIIGAISIEPEREMDDLPVWTYDDGSQCELARIVIAGTYQGQGLAALMVSNILTVLKERRCNVVRLAAAVCNLPAWKTYCKLGFQILGEDDLFGSHYYLMEKLL